MKSFVLGTLGVVSLVAAGSLFAATAEETYKSACSTCHDAGVANAPKLGDKAAWAPRVKQGKGCSLCKSALEGQARHGDGGQRRVFESVGCRRHGGGRFDDGKSQVSDSIPPKRARLRARRFFQPVAVGSRRQIDNEGAPTDNQLSRYNNYLCIRETS